MSRTVIGFHGTVRAVAEALLQGRDDWRASRNGYDWLGHGIYFWEGDARRAVRYLEGRAARTGIDPKDCQVIGAEISLGRCLDLTTQDGIDSVAIAHRELVAIYAAERRALPRNGGPAPGYVVRRLDCEVVNLTLELAAMAGRPYDTVRAAFAEGSPAYPGAGFTRLGHIQISVVLPAAIRAVFDPATRGYRLA